MGLKINKMWGYEVDLSEWGYSAMVDVCEHGNKPYGLFCFK